MVLKFLSPAPTALVPCARIQLLDVDCNLQVTVLVDHTPLATSVRSLSPLQLVDPILAIYMTCLLLEHLPLNVTVTLALTCTSTEAAYVASTSFYRSAPVVGVGCVAPSLIVNELSCQHSTLCVEPSHSVATYWLIALSEQQHGLPPLYVQELTCQPLPITTRRNGTYHWMAVPVDRTCPPVRLLAFTSPRCVHERDIVLTLSWDSDTAAWIGLSWFALLSIYTSSIFWRCLRRHHEILWLGLLVSLSQPLLVSMPYGMYLLFTLVALLLPLVAMLFWFGSQIYWYQPKDFVLPRRKALWGYCQGTVFVAVQLCLLALVYHIGRFKD